MQCNAYSCGYCLLATSCFCWLHDYVSCKLLSVLRKLRRGFCTICVLHYLWWLEYHNNYLLSSSSLDILAMQWLLTFQGYIYRYLKVIWHYSQVHFCLKSIFIVRVQNFMPIYRNQTLTPTKINYNVWSHAEHYMTVVLKSWHNKKIYG